MNRLIIWFSGLTILFLAVYGAGTFGCQYFPSLAQSCDQSQITAVFSLGLMYIAVFMSMLIIPIWTLMYLRITVMMGLSKIVYGDYKTLESKLGIWLSNQK